MEPRPFDVFDARCPSREVLDHIVSRWGSLTLAVLRPGPLRFAELTRAIGGISDRMLSRTLKVLEVDGLVSRTSTGLQHVEYELTPQGVAVADALRGLIEALYGVMPAVLSRRPLATATARA